MRIAILGAGFTGLSAAYRLLKKGHQVVIFEKENSIGGLVVGFGRKEWDWTIERGYHHWFTNDDDVLNLAKEINHKVIITKPSTDILTDGKRIPLDTPFSLLTFSALPFIDRVRMGLVLAYLKLSGNQKSFADITALKWIKKWMGEKSTNLIWEPLLSGKFGDFKEKIALSWFWARIKKRTPSLAYPEGGFQRFANKLAGEIKRLGGEIQLNSTVLNIKNHSNKCIIKTDKKEMGFDKVIVTLPSPIFTKLAPDLPEEYSKKINSIQHLHAQVLILILKKPFMDKTYWLNITDKNFPFLVLAEHTNFMDPKHYGNQHILYIGNYLPNNHPYLKMSKDQLLKKFLPYLKKINSQLSIVNSQLFTAPFAQPVVTTDYLKFIPTFQTPLKNIYLANLDMVYPWDRGTNYAVEMGEKVAEIIQRD
ncbi:MAG: NAD(P)/FAD-dependent oxidoreductase [Candidatus Daviesbacteria bacterium]|nr:NAD(P)/FAD-dependent oxidoreductase [Candidatus Daviesbacteria bacterium]